MTATPETTKTTRNTETTKPAEPRSVVVLDRPTRRRTHRGAVIAVVTIVAAVVAAGWITFQYTTGGDDGAAPEASATQGQSQPQVDVQIRQPFYGSRGEVPASFARPESQAPRYGSMAEVPATFGSTNSTPGTAAGRRPLTIKDVDDMTPPRRPLTIKDVDDVTIRRPLTRTADRPAGRGLEAR